MANLVAAFRTNAFAVRDRAAFEAWLDTRIRPNVEDDLTVHWQDDRVLLGAYDSPPSSDWQTDEEIDFMLELSHHLAPGHVALLHVAGHEKLRAVFGWAEAVDATGTRLALSLHDIAERAEAAFPGQRISLPHL